MPRDPARVAKTKSWLVKAAKDLGAAAFEFGATSPFLKGYSITGFSRQAAKAEALPAS